MANKNAEREPKRTTGTARDATKEQQILNRRKARGSGEIADWGSVDGALLQQCVERVTKHGYALLVGYTRDQGAYTVRVVGLENVDADYIRPTEDINLYLTGLSEDFA